MDITQLRYFLKTAETMNYTRAAESLFISRQALRQALTALERELGQPLFANDRNHLSLTGYGEYLLFSFRELVRDFEERESRTKEFFNRPTELQVTIAASMSPYMLPNLDRVLLEFRNTYPHISFCAREVSDNEALDGAEKGDTDLACVFQMPTPRPNCVGTVLRISDVAIGSGPQSPLYGKAEVTPEELAGVSLVGMGDLEKIALPLWQDCRERGITLNYQIITNTIDALYLLRNGPYSGFTTFLNERARVMNSSVTFRSRLMGYTWEVAALCPRNRPNHAAAQILAAFLKEKYAS